MNVIRDLDYKHYPTTIKFAKWTKNEDFKKNIPHLKTKFIINKKVFIQVPITDSYKQIIPFNL